ncbi:MAG TPA: hypothetical protein VHD60_02510 [Candidatus Saccharimonadales bacterium]|nr:hypothetical protein [Candidatus Saccharimonadales bacterium]
MATIGRVFMGTPESAAMMQPWISPAPLCYTGIPLGIDLRTRRIVYFDPWMLKRDGFINATLFLVEGEKGGGKSTLMKSLGVRLSMMQAGINPMNSEPQFMRVRVHDRKPEDGEPEYKRLTDFLHSQIVSLNRSASINLFDPAMKMDEADLLETAVNVCEMASGQPLRGFPLLALQVGVYRMLTEFAEAASPEILEHILRGLNSTDIGSYYWAHNERVAAQLQTKFSSESPIVKALLGNVGHHNIPAQEFERDAALVASYIGRILRGDFGHIFGGQESLRDMLSQPMVTFDWTGLNEKARSMLAAMMWKWQTVALANNDLDLIPHISFRDEEHEAFRNLMYVRFMADSVTKARAYHTAEFISTQDELKLTTSGEEGSEIRRLTESIRRGIDTRFITRLPQDDAVLHHMSQLGISDLDLHMLTRLPVGCFGLKVPDRPILFFQHILTPSEYPLIQTDSANTRMTVRTPVLSTDELQRWVVQNGRTTIGEES